MIKWSNESMYFNLKSKRDWNVEIKQITREVNFAPHILAGLMKHFLIGLKMLHATPSLVANQIRSNRRSLVHSLAATYFL